MTSTRKHFLKNLLMAMTVSCLPKILQPAEPEISDPNLKWDQLKWERSSSDIVIKYYNTNLAEYMASYVSRSPQQYEKYRDFFRHDNTASLLNNPNG